MTSANAESLQGLRPADIVKVGDAAGGDLAGTFPSPTIAAGAITVAMMDDLNASKLLGRGDSGVGPPQEISLGSGLSMTGTTLSATGGAGGPASWARTFASMGA